MWPGRPLASWWLAGPREVRRTMADAVDVTAEREIRAAQQAAEATAAAQRDLHGQHPGVGVSTPDQDPEYRRVTRDG